MESTCFLLGIHSALYATSYVLLHAMGIIELLPAERLANNAKRPQKTQTKEPIR